MESEDAFLGWDVPEIHPDPVSMQMQNFLGMLMTLPRNAKALLEHTHPREREALDSMRYAFNNTIASANGIVFSGERYEPIGHTELIGLVGDIIDNAAMDAAAMHEEFGPDNARNILSPEEVKKSLERMALP